MAIMRRTELMLAIDRAAAKAQVDWHSQYSRAEQVIVFGSFAVGVQRKESDIDVLCVGNGRTVSKPSLHLLWVSPADLDKHIRHGTELACHISAYGVWLKGVRTFPND